MPGLDETEVRPLDSQPGYDLPGRHTFFGLEPFPHRKQNAQGRAARLLQEIVADAEARKREIEFFAGNGPHSVRRASLIRQIEFSPIQLPANNLPFASTLGQVLAVAVAAINQQIEAEAAALAAETAAGPHRHHRTSDDPLKTAAASDTEDDGCGDDADDCDDDDAPESSVAGAAQGIGRMHVVGVRSAKDIPASDTGTTLILAELPEAEKEILASIAREGKPGIAPKLNGKSFDEVALLGLSRHLGLSGSDASSLLRAIRAWEDENLKPVNVMLANMELAAAARPEAMFHSRVTNLPELALASGKAA